MYVQAAVGAWDDLILIDTVAFAGFALSLELFDVVDESLIAVDLALVLLPLFLFSLFTPPLLLAQQFIYLCNVQPRLLSLLETLIKL